MQFKDAKVPFKIIEGNPYKQRYMLYMIHALGIKWASGSTHSFSDAVSEGTGYVFFIREHAGAVGYAITYGHSDADNHMLLTLDGLEKVYKKHVSLWGVDELEKSSVNEVRQEYYDSIVSGCY